ncbi:tetratricopeptide repeat protein [Dehalobacter sp. DCM]|uniref:tetratricopeptide repeat protein n=1 Tax=Dehalobacter sp. DCM TaxID=2907827 RepID=UPI003081A6F3|nr:tetratricopeptide repeat protein [Dehalobacter sp. DCM]
METQFMTEEQAKLCPRNEIDFATKIHINWLIYKGEENKAVEILNESLHGGLAPSKLYLKTVTKLIEKQLFKESQEYLEKVVVYADDPMQLAQIYYLLARCCYGQGFIDDALNYLKNATGIEPCSEFANLQADCLLELGEWEAAITCLNTSLRASPGNAETIYRLGSIFLFHGQYREALNCFNGCCKVVPTKPEFLEMKAEMLLKMNKISAASECFRKALYYGGDLHLYARLAYCKAQEGDYKKARSLLQKALKHDPDDVDALCNLAGVYHNLHQDDLAYRLLRKARSLNSNDALLLNNLGFICYQLGRSRKALEYYNEALLIDPADKNILYNMSICMAEKGMWDDARMTLERLLSLDKAYTDAWILLGNVYEQQANISMAVDCYNKSLGLAMKKIG